jgi:Na+-translocating ferredoxin:NAD+ oxidoreductase RnfD subunit
VTLMASLAPVALLAMISGGWSVTFVILSTMLLAWVTDFLLRRASSLRERDDGSALLWGLCLSLLMPPGFPFGFLGREFCSVCSPLKL